MRYSDTYCGSYKFISSGPKRLLKTLTFGKKAISLVKKRCWPNFPHVVEDYNPQGKKYYVPRGILTSIVQVIKLIL